MTSYGCNKDTDLDPPDKCKEPNCIYYAYRQGLCHEHWIAMKEDEADYLRDQRRDDMLTGDY